MKHISIEPSFAVWRRVARALLRQGVEPSQIEWAESGSDAAAENPVRGDDSGGGHAVQSSATAVVESLASSLSSASTTGEPDAEFTRTAAGCVDINTGGVLAIPRELLSWLRTAACFRAPDRWSLVYRVLWRWTHGERNVLDLGDPDGALLDQRIRTVEHETDALLTLTLFRRRDPSMGPPEFVGWYEPHHDLLERAAARFANRMGESTWMLATPHGAVFWNGMLLRIDRPLVEEYEQTTQTSTVSAMTGEAVTSTPTEALWLAYYASAFNAQPSPVPLRHWRMPPAGPPLPAHLARERSRLGAQSAAVTVPPTPPLEYSAMTPPLREPTGPLATCRRCALWRNAKHAVAGTGPAHAAIMVVGEQPGEHENQHGKPFTGPAGELLDAVLARAGLERQALYLTYAVKHYKWETLDGKRVHRIPVRREVEACQYWLEKELTRIAPRVVVTLGATALRALTGAHVNLSEYLGQTIAHEGRLIVPAWHPSYALGMADATLREDVVTAMVKAFSRAAALAG
ncbi:UdgX family uracil-DNA binding protein [Paraburkholderia fungorum]|uniref:UdgX family uracil-DNA binding protein n=1 Tax=Paraburkholderia fungorum TaxID=134537 RepID=UPI0038BC81FB